MLFCIVIVEKQELDIDSYVAFGVDLGTHNLLITLHLHVFLFILTHTTFNLFKLLTSLLIEKSNRSQHSIHVVVVFPMKPKLNPLNLNPLGQPVSNKRPFLVQILWRRLNIPSEDKG